MVLCYVCVSKRKTHTHTFLLDFPDELLDSFEAEDDVFFNVDFGRVGLATRGPSRDSCISESSVAMPLLGRELRVSVL